MVDTATAVRFDEKLVSRYGGRGPRYTSYPTALQFTGNFTADAYRRNAMASNDSGKPLSVYVHIPFCRSLCYYCGCNKIVTRNASRVQSYLEALYTEIGLQAALFDRGRKLRQLHFGGGTPTYLQPQQLSELMSRLGQAFSFDQGSAREFSIEVDPRTVDRDAIGRLRDLGFNRLSLGVQDFDSRVQAAVNRLQSVQDLDRLLDTARRLGFRSVSFDLIYGLPQQTVESFDRTLETVISMRPDRLAVYSYAHLPQRFRGQRMIREADLPPPPVKLRLLGETVERLTAAGYEYIGMDHFALPGDELALARRNGTLQRNFQGYSTHGDCDLVGLGVSAIGSIGPAYSQNAVDTAGYQAALAAGRLPVCRGIAVDEDDRLRAKIIQSLMCYDELDLQAFGAANGIAFESYFADELVRLEPLQADGLIELLPHSLRITPAGRLLLRSIAMVFDRYLPAEQDTARYSKVI